MHSNPHGVASILRTLQAAEGPHLALLRFFLSVYLFILVGWTFAVSAAPAAPSSSSLLSQYRMEKVN